MRIISDREVYFVPQELCGAAHDPDGACHDFPVRGARRTPAGGGALRELREPLDNTKKTKYMSSKNTKLQV